MVTEGHLRQNVYYKHGTHSLTHLSETLDRTEMNHHKQVAPHDKVLEIQAVCSITTIHYTAWLSLADVKNVNGDDG